MTLFAGHPLIARFEMVGPSLPCVVDVNSPHWKLSPAVVAATAPPPLEPLPVEHQFCRPTFFLRHSAPARGITRRTKIKPLLPAQASDRSP